ncbi:hypothetical protein [Maricaulis sp.]|uniref:hypothetical protein n=1 Tax=Maricaulis sp. TaxID=1486257 RepID=UPI003A95351E
MRRKPISIPEEPDRHRSHITPDLVRAERAAIMVILAHVLCLLLVAGFLLLLFRAAPDGLPWALGLFGLVFVGLIIAGLRYLDRQSS